VADDSKGELVPHTYEGFEEPVFLLLAVPEIDFTEDSDETFDGALAHTGPVPDTVPDLIVLETVPETVPETVADPSEVKTDGPEGRVLAQT
jgi:hypothetical protein